MTASKLQKFYSCFGYSVLCAVVRISISLEYPCRQLNVTADQGRGSMSK